MGGMIAQLVAINHPDRTKSLISIMSTTGRRDLPSGNPETLSVLFRPPNSTSRDDLIDASILVQKALAGPGFPSSEAEMRARAERRTDHAPFDMDGIARQSAALIVAQPRNELLKEVRCPALVHARRRRSGDPRGRRPRTLPRASPAPNWSSFPAWATTSPRRSCRFTSSTSAILSRRWRRALSSVAPSRFVCCERRRNQSAFSPCAPGWAPARLRQHRNQGDDKPGEDRRGEIAADLEAAAGSPACRADRRASLRAAA